MSDFLLSSLLDERSTLSCAALYRGDLHGNLFVIRSDMATDSNRTPSVVVVVETLIRDNA